MHDVDGLMAANSYQKRTVTLQEVIERIEVGDHGGVARVILSVSPCRSGTTVFLRVFGASGIQSHYQELKNVLRWQMQAGEAEWQIPQLPTDGAHPSETIYLKETLGPYTETEACFNPLDVLLKAGVPPEKLHIVVIGRAPFDTWASWDAWWRGVTSVDWFILAYQTTEQIRRQAYQYQIPVTVFIYEAIRDNGPGKAIGTLFNHLGIPYSSIAVGGWQALPAFGMPGSNIILPEEPPAFIVPDLHLLVEQADGLTYYARNQSFQRVDPNDWKKIKHSDVSSIYEIWREMCERDLNVQVNKDTKEI
ncbi:MAG: hypothetical protein ACE5GO_08735 [Anaerolineales bacterium]